jgi:thiamine biosynthesis lipoprotein
VRFAEHTMGMPISLALRGDLADRPSGRAAWAQVMEELHWVDRVFSTWRDDSAVSRLRRGELSVADCPAEVSEVLTLGEQARLDSGGAFSCWRPDGRGRVVLDPTGVVKGWAVERAAAVLRGLDGTDFCLSAGGDLVCRTVAPDSAPWQVGIEHPHDTGRLIARVPVRTGAVATSGTSHRGAHLVDARTGQPPSGVSSVTVVAQTLTWADIDATAAYAMGPGAAAWLQTRPGRTALVVWEDGSSERVRGPDPAVQPVRTR